MAKKKVEQTLTINNKTYSLAELPQEATKQLANLQIVEAEIKRLQMQLAIAQTARNAYKYALVQALPKN